MTNPCGLNSTGKVGKAKIGQFQKVVKQKK